MCVCIRIHSCVEELRVAPRESVRATHFEGARLPEKADDDRLGQSHGDLITCGRVIRRTVVRCQMSVRAEVLIDAGRYRG